MSSCGVGCDKGSVFRAGTPLVTDSEKLEQAISDASEGCCNHTSVNRRTVSQANTWKLTQGRVPM